MIVRHLLSPCRYEKHDVGMLLVQPESTEDTISSSSATHFQDESLIEIESCLTKCSSFPEVKVEDYVKPSNMSPHYLSSINQNTSIDQPR